LFADKDSEDWKFIFSFPNTDHVGGYFIFGAHSFQTYLVPNDEIPIIELNLFHLCIL